jgi:hypothetical protein
VKQRKRSEKDGTEREWEKHEITQRSKEAKKQRNKEDGNGLIQSHHSCFFNREL